MRRGDSYGGMGLHFPSQDAFAIETQGAIQDRTQEHLGSTDIVIIGVRKALLMAIKDMQEGKEVPWLQRDPKENPFAEFVCASGYVGEDEDGQAYCKRLLAERKAKV